MEEVSIYKNLSLSNLEGEIWKDVVGYEGLYAVSSLGRVKSIRNNKIRAQYVNNGYLTLNFYNDNCKHFTVHRLVAQAFIPNPENKPQVNHIDCDIENNRVSNLEWVFAFENVRHAIENNLKPSYLGVQNPKVKLTEVLVLEIRRLYESGVYKNNLEISKVYNVTESTINDVVKRRTWKHI